MTTSNSVIQINATTYFPIKLTTTNFPVWRKQVQSTLIGLDLDRFINANATAPPRFLDKEETKANPEFTAWFRQDQVIISAILGSCTDPIQPTISSATTSREAWERLTTSYASISWSRIISLKSKLNKNPKGTRTMAEYLQDMRFTADELALAQSPIDEEDLIVHILSNLGNEYQNMVAAIKVREHPITYPEIYDKLVDYERLLEESKSQTPLIPTTNTTQRQNSQNSRPPSRNFNNYNRNFRQNTNNQPRNNRSTWQQNTNTAGGYRNNRNNLHCQYCLIDGHDTRDCRKLARFLKDNNITIVGSNNSPVANTSQSNPNIPQNDWMFDSGASHHMASDRNSIPNLSEYGGPDEIVLGNGSTHGGAPHAGGEYQ